MTTFITAMALALAPAGTGVVIDRVAITVGYQVIKESDITRDIRITSFLNGEPPDFSAKARRASANRLLDQLFIRREIEVGVYAAIPAESDVDRLLAQIKKERFGSEDAFQRGLNASRITADELRAQLLWQLTVLKFIDLRFRPGVLVTEEDIEKYFRERAADRSKNNPRSNGESRSDVEEAVAAEKVNQSFYAWLDRRRKATKIAYREEELK